MRSKLSTADMSERITLSPTLSPSEDFDRVNGRFAEFYIDADGFGAVVDKLEQADGGIGLAVDGAAYEEDVFQVFEFDGAIDAKIWARAHRERFGELDVDGDGAVLDGGIDAGDQAFYDAVAGVNGGGLAEDDVFGLGFGDFDFGFEALGIGDAGEVVAGLDVLADFDGNDLENAADACANVEGIEFAFLEIVESTLLIDFGLLRLDASAGGVFRVFGAIIFELERARRVAVP